MEHKSAIKEVKPHGNDQISYLFRCCDDMATDMWRTLAVTFSDDEHDAKIAVFHAEIQSLHAAMLYAMERALKLVTA